jgi:hypothetical protein
MILFCAGCFELSNNTPFQLPAAQIGVPYATTLSASGGRAPYRWSVVSGSLPPGLNLTAGTGGLSGIPTQIGSFKFSIQWVDSSSPSPKAFVQSIGVNVDAPSPQITASVLANAQVGIHYEESVKATGGVQPYQWSIASGRLPSGLSLNAASGMLSGTPSRGGQFDFSVQVRDSSSLKPQTAMKALTLSVLAFALQITPGGLPNGQVGVPFQTAITGNGGVTPYTRSVMGALPAGLSLNASSGAIAGTPTQAGTSAFTIVLTDSAGQKAQESSSITIAAAGAPVCGTPPQPPPTSGLSLVCSGTGINQTVTVESIGQFRLVFEAADNWGISQWYDLVNDPNAMTNLLLAYGVGGASDPCARENGMQEMTFYGDNDKKLQMYEAGCGSIGNATMTVIASSPSLAIIKTTANPISNLGVIDTNVTGTITYYIFPNGKIYTQVSLGVVLAQDLTNGGNGGLYFAFIGLNDPASTGSRPPDSQKGWVRATSNTNPWDGNGTVDPAYIFAYWDATTPTYGNFTKASMMIVPSPVRSPSAHFTEFIHNWSCGTGCGTVRWGYQFVIAGSPLNMSAGQTITYDFLIQLGTQNSSLLPNINSSAVAGPIADSYRANPTLPPVPPPSGTTPVAISPSVPPAVNQGTTFQFAANAAGTWSCSATDVSGTATTCKGSIDPSTGLYKAPAIVTAQHSLGGHQLLPNNHIFNMRIDSLPVNSNSPSWMNKLIAASPTGNPHYEPSQPLNYANGSTPTDNMVFYYTPLNSGSFQIPAYPDVNIQGGWFSARTNQNADHHLQVIDTTTGTFQEQYQYYAVGLNGGCPLCNSQSGLRYSNSSYALPANGTTDAAGLELMPLELTLQEWEQAVATRSTINHALRMTMGLGFECSCNVWPATSFASDGGFLPFGARARLKSSFNISGFSPIAQVLLKQMQQYGLINADGGTMWDIDGQGTNWPQAYRQAMFDIENAHLASNMEFVDESGLMVSPPSGLTIANREIVTFTRASDSATASVDVVLQGVAINLPNDALYIQASTPSQQFTAFVNIGAVTWTMSPSVGTLTSGGLYTPPATVGSPTTTTLTATSAVNSGVAALMTVTILPTGTIRLVPGSVPGAINGVDVPTPYTDSQGNVWYATGDDGGYGGDAGVITGKPDPTLYRYALASWPDPQDQRFDLTVPNGSYQITYKAASTFGAAGTQVQKLEVNGNIVYDNLDLFVVSGGHNVGWDFVTPVTVTNDRLSFVIRGLNNGSHIGSLQIAPQ